MTDINLIVMLLHLKGRVLMFNCLHASGLKATSTED